MKKDLKKSIPLFSLAVCLAIILTGCGPSGREVSSTSEPTQDDPGEQSPTTSISSTASADTGDDFVSAGPSHSEVEWHFDSETGTLSFDGIGALSKTEPETASYIDYGWASVSDEATSIVIGEGITHIPSFSFYGFSKVESVILPSTLTSIGTYAFFQCAVQEIIFPNSVERIGPGAFSNCKQLRTCDIQEKVTVLESFVFEECVTLENITFQEGLEELREGCLKGCDNINSLVIPSSVTDLGELYASGIRVMVFMGDPPILPQDPMTGEYRLGYDNLMVYYPDGNKKWPELAEHCRKDIIWIEGIPGDGA